MPIIEIKDDAHWHQLRFKFGGSSEVGALFGQGYEDLPSKWSLWAIHAGKMATPNLDEDDRIWLGKVLEPIIADAVARKMGWDLVEKRIYVTHPNEALRMGSTVDRYVIEHEDGPGICELKNRDYLRWADSYTMEDASMRDRMQLAHQMCCHPEVTWGAVGVLVGGSELMVYTYKREDLADIMADIETEWADLWRCIAEDDEPDLMGDELPNWLRVHNEKLADVAAPIIIEDGSFDDTVAAFLAADAIAKDNAKDAKSLKAQIIQKLEKHSRGRSNRFTVRASYANVAASEISLPLEHAAFLRALAGRVSEEDTAKLLEIAGWAAVTRKDFTRVSLKFDDTPIHTRDPEAAAAENRAQPKPSEAAKKAAMDFQKPLTDPE